MVACCSANSRVATGSTEQTVHAQFDDRLVQELPIGQIREFRGASSGCWSAGVCLTEYREVRSLQKISDRTERADHCLEVGAVAIDNNHLERQIKPWAMGRRTWLFAGSELAGQRTAMVMSLVQSARLNGHDPWAYLRDVLARLPTQRSSQIEDLLPHRWQAVSGAAT